MSKKPMPSASQLRKAQIHVGLGDEVREQE